MRASCFITSTSSSLGGFPLHLRGSRARTRARATDPLHGDGGVYYTSGYDAGTERNNETFAFLPNLSLVFFVRDLENGVITHHPGIRGGGALIPAVHGWNDPVARITLTRQK